MFRGMTEIPKKASWYSAQFQEQNFLLPYRKGKHICGSKKWQMWHLSSWLNIKAYMSRWLLSQGFIFEVPCTERVQPFLALALRVTLALWHVKNSSSAEAFRKVGENSYVQGTLCFGHLGFITACRGEELSRFFAWQDGTEGNDFSWPQHKPVVSGKETAGPISSLD